MNPYRTLPLAVLTAIPLVLGPAGTARGEVTDRPVAVSVAIPESSGGDVGDVAVGIFQAGANVSCSTTAIPPQELDPIDVTRVTARAEVACGEARYRADVTVAFAYFGSQPAGPVGAGSPAGSPYTEEGPTPLSARTYISKLDARAGWYRTVAVSRVSYPYRLDTSRPAGDGCSYIGSFVIQCTASSSPVYVETAKAIMNIIRGDEQP